MISENLPFIVNCYVIMSRSIRFKKKISYPLGIIDNTMYYADFLKAPSLLSGACVHLGSKAGEVGRKRQPMFIYEEKTGNVQDRPEKEPGLEAEHLVNENSLPSLKILTDQLTNLGRTSIILNISPFCILICFH